MPSIEEVPHELEVDDVVEHHFEYDANDPNLDPGQAPPPNAFRVLITGFGPQPFAHYYPTNPSWLAVKPLHNTVHKIEPLPGPPPPPEPVSTPAISGGVNGSRASPPPGSKPSSAQLNPPSSSNGYTRGSQPQSQSKPTQDGEPPKPTPRRPIHVSCLEVPVSYGAVLNSVPGFHLRPPVVRPTIQEAKFYEPPEGGYDFIFHIGVAGRGPLRMERVGHKVGYQMKDATGKLAKLVRNSPKDFSRTGGSGPGGSGGTGTGTTGSGGSTGSGSGFNSNNGSGFGSGSSGFGGNWNGNYNNNYNYGIGSGSAGGLNGGTPGGGDGGMKYTRGFGDSAYENFPDELTTEIDVTRLVQDLKRSGVDQIYTSMDAGHYLCDYIYYCSLAEAKRSSKPYEKRRNTQVLFMHCPPAGQPIHTEDVTEAIRRTIIWVCNEIQNTDESDSNSGMEIPAPPQAGLPAIGRPTN
ncbi:hypothetical protein AX16_006968 [Volvariella volvacea WC 439]|nr:hypothetical protein AX16_006968 [Volvariella volvacea WC 439]